MRLSWHIASAREPPPRARVCQERAWPETYPRSRLRALETMDAGAPLSIIQAALYVRSRMALDGDGHVRALSPGRTYYADRGARS